MSKFTQGKGSGGLGLSDEEAREVQSANARLIAAAPEMHKLLNLLSFYIFESEKFYKPFPHELVTYAEEAKELLERIDGDESL